MDPDRSVPDSVWVRALYWLSFVIPIPVLNMSSTRFRFLPIFLVMIGFASMTGCDSQEQQDEFVQDAGGTPEGFARTDATGRILDDDENDWRVAPIYGGKVRFDPAYPNPVAGSFVTIPVTILEFNSIQGGLTLRARDASGSLRTLDDILDASDPGAYIFRFSPALLNRTGIVRIFIFDRLGELVSYGDVMIQ
jgi:hypothetical protein